MEFDSYPSGHSTTAVAFVLGAVLVSSPRWRDFVGLVGSVAAAGFVTGVVAAGWHRPSDALGEVALAVTCLSLAGWYLAADAKSRGRVEVPGWLFPAYFLLFLGMVAFGLLWLYHSPSRDIPTDVSRAVFPAFQIFLTGFALSAVAVFSVIASTLRIPHDNEVGQW